eukprot:3888687-Amphidinium_carterae.2
MRVSGSTIWTRSLWDVFKRAAAGPSTLFHVPLLLANFKAWPPKAAKAASQSSRPRARRARHVTNWLIWQPSTGSKFFNCVSTSCTFMGLALFGNLHVARTYLLMRPLALPSEMPSTSRP